MSYDGKRMQILNYDHLIEIPDEAPTNFIQDFYRDQKMIFKKYKETISERFSKHHYALIRSFMQSIKSDSDPPVKLEDGKRTIVLLECIEKSLNIKEPVGFEIF
jgi:hypothetical protein